VAEHTGIVVHAWMITAVYCQDLDSKVSKTTHNKFHELDRPGQPVNTDGFMASVSLYHETKAINPSVFPG